MKQFFGGVRHSRFNRYGLTISVILAVVLAISLSARAQGDKTAVQMTYYNSHQTGVRLGGWANLGDSPADSVGGATSTAFYVTDFNGGSFYIEGFVAYRLSSALLVEISGGVASRGEVTLVEEDGSSYYGSMHIHPIMLKFRLYPMESLARRFHPYLMAGGGVYYGRHDIQIELGGDVWRAFDEDSQTKLGYVLGGGFDWSAASKIALGLNMQYMPIKFSDKLIGIDDYSALTITLGVNYLFTSGKKQKDE